MYTLTARKKQKNLFSVVSQVIETGVKAWKSKKGCGDSNYASSCRHCFSQLHSVYPNFHQFLSAVIEIGIKFSIFLL